MGVVSVRALSDEILRASVRILARILRRVPGIGVLVGHSLVEGAGSELSFAAITAAVCSITVLLTVIQSSVNSIDAWITATYTERIDIDAGVPSGGFGGEAINKAVVEVIRRTPGVDDLSEFYGTLVPFAHTSVVLQGVSASQRWHSKVTRAHETSRLEATAALLRGEALVSQGFSRYFRKTVGDYIELKTRNGLESFRIGGLTTDFGGPTGTILLDIATYDRWFAREGATNVFVWSHLPLETVERNIRLAVGDRQPLFFNHGKNGLHTATKVSRRFGALLYLVLSISASFCAGALLNLLSAGVTARRRDLAIMQVTGATPSNIALGVVVDAMILATLSTLSGIFIGSFAGRVLCDYFLEKFGWFIDYSVEANAIVLPFAVLFFACGAIGLIPAAQARRIDPVALVNAG